MTHLTLLTRIVKTVMIIFILGCQISTSSATKPHQSQVTCDAVLFQKCQQVCQDSVCVDSYEHGAETSPVCQCEEELKKEGNYNCLDAEISTMCATKCSEISEGSYQGKICTLEESNISDIAPICLCQNPSLKSKRSVEESEQKIRHRRAGDSKTTESASGPDDRIPAAMELRKAVESFIAKCEDIKKANDFKATDADVLTLDKIVVADVEKLDKLNATAEGTSKDNSKGNSKDTSKDTSKDASKDASKETSEDGSKEIPKETPEDS